MDQLVRVVRPDGGVVRIGRQEPGRGAWLCRGSPTCFERAVRTKAFDRALRCRTGEDEITGLGSALRTMAGEDDEDRQRAQRARSRDVRG